MIAFFRRSPLLTAAIAVVVLTILWAAFRPELLVVNKHVDDPFPQTTSSSR